MQGDKKLQWIEIEQSIEKAIRADKKTPWPDHVAAQAARVTVEAGKLQSASMDHKYKEDCKLMMQEAAVKTIAACYRFLDNLK